jgi:hypothetical protein
MAKDLVQSLMLDHRGQTNAMLRMVRAKQSWRILTLFSVDSLATGVANFPSSMLYGMTKFFSLASLPPPRRREGAGSPARDSAPTLFPRPVEPPVLFPDPKSPCCG